MHTAHSVNYAFSGNGSRPILALHVMCWKGDFPGSVSFSLYLYFEMKDIKEIEETFGFPIFFCEKWNFKWEDLVYV